MKKSPTITSFRWKMRKLNACAAHRIVVELSTKREMKDREREREGRQFAISTEKR